VSRRLRGLAPLAAVALGSWLAIAADARALKETRNAPTGRLGLRAVDTLFVRDGGHAKELEKWASDAPLADLLWLMRRSPEEIGATYLVLARAALAKAPASDLSLTARLVTIAGPGARPRHGLPTNPTASPRPTASIFRVGAILPDSGDYADYARSVAIGLDIGLHSIPIGGERTIDLEFWGTGADDPARVASALEAASFRDGAIVGDLLTVNTMAVATGARILMLPLVSPTATDESIGTIGFQTFQIGPSGWIRGQRLARAIVTRPGMRFGLLTAGDPERNAFALGFAAAAESLGATLEWKYGYAAGTLFRNEVQQLATKKLDVLLWDGEPGEVEALLREMSRQKVTVLLGGGDALAPERMHAETRLLMEGIRYVSEEWKLPQPEQNRLDSALVVRGLGPSTPLYLRGWLAGRAIASAIANGALCSEDLIGALHGRVGPPPWLSPHRFLDLSSEGVTLPLFTVQRGRAVVSPQ